MCQSGFDVVQWIGWLLLGIVVIIFLIVFIEVNEVGIAIIIVAVLPLRAVVGKMLLLSTLEACVVSYIA